MAFWAAPAGAEGEPLLVEKPQDRAGRPIETSEGWLDDHGVCPTCGYVTAWAPPSRSTIRQVIADWEYLLTPEMPYETNGFVANGVFPCAALTDSETGRITVYGAADTVSAWPSPARTN
jgi:beta-1,4-mannooligosaccharide/beta-1,4-mannosyl-N-acetylglucosamine phosphorylase